MEVTVSARHTEVPERLRLLAEEKIGRLDRFVDGMERAEVHFTEHKNPRIADREQCEVTIEGHGHHIRCKVAAPDGYVAVDRAVAKLEQQLHKLKTKLHRQRQRHTVPRLTAPDGDRPPEPPTGQPPTSAATATARDGGPAKIVKVKRFAPIAMTAEDGASRMDLLGHGFFFFTNIDTGRAAVVYRREDGDVGLIDEAD